jgi:hypothetical protein
MFKGLMVTMDKFAYIFPFIFVGMWILVTYMISKMGWDKLVEKFRYKGPFEGDRIGIISATINSGNYNKVIILRCNQQGIFLKTIFFFRLFHPSVFIPWKEIKEIRDRKVLFIQCKELVVGNPFVAMITMKASTYNKIEKSVGYIPKF